MAKLEKLPGWAVRMNEAGMHFSLAGFHGLIDHHAATNALGVLLANGRITSAELLAWMKEREAESLSKMRMLSPMSALIANPKLFWEKYWGEILKQEVTLPDFPKLQGKTKRAIEMFNLMPMFLLDLNEKALKSMQFPQIYKSKSSVSYSGDIDLGSLPGCWILVETIGVQDGRGYANAFGSDPLATELDLSTRYGLYWKDLEAEKFPLIAKSFGLPSKAIRLPNAKEWNLIANLFGWLNWRFDHKVKLPYLGSVSCPELTSTRGEVKSLTSEDSSRITIGDSHHARTSALECGQQSIRCTWKGEQREIGWRVIATLNSPIFRKKNEAV